MCIVVAVRKIPDRINPTTIYEVLNMARYNRQHYHPCKKCGVKTPCPGDYVQNYDGFPEVICDEHGDTDPDFVCEDCYDKAETEPLGPEYDDDEA